MACATTFAGLCDNVSSGTLVYHIVTCCNLFLFLLVYIYLTGRQTKSSVRDDTDVTNEKQNVGSQIFAGTPGDEEEHLLTE